MSDNLRLIEFIEKECCQLAGIRVGYGQFCRAFWRWLQVDERRKWTKTAIGKALDDLGLARGRGAGGSYFIGNLDLRNNRPTYVLMASRRLIKQPA